jgi:hypothetical protein
MRLFEPVAAIFETLMELCPGSLPSDRRRFIDGCSRFIPAFSAGASPTVNRRTATIAPTENDYRN